MLAAEVFGALSGVDVRLDVVFGQRNKEENSD